MKIQDGTGTGRLAKVNAKQRLDVTAATITQRALTAVLDAKTFTWTTSWSADTGEYIMYIKNTSKTRLLFIDKVTVNSVNAGLFELFQVTGTPAGSIITGKNTNLTSSNSADAVSYADAEVTGLTESGRIDLARTPANGRADMELQDVLVLGLGNAIGLKYTGATGLVDVIITGYFEVEEDL